MEARAMGSRSWFSACRVIGNAHEHIDDNDTKAAKLDLKVNAK